MLAAVEPILKPKRNRSETKSRVKLIKPSERRVEPELLDHLPSGDPAAIRSRSDLRLINCLMGNHRWIIAQLATHLGSAGGVAGCGWELGAGDGELGAAIARRFGSEGFQLNALDLAPRSSRWPSAWDWQQHDLLATARTSPPADFVVANLLLHHFEDDELAQIGRWISKASTIIAVEPLRAGFPHLLAYAMRLLGINYVTREDIHTSIHAGFEGDELPKGLGLDRSDWEISISATPLGAYRMLARRRPHRIKT